MNSQSNWTRKVAHAKHNFRPNNAFMLLDRLKCSKLNQIASNQLQNTRNYYNKGTKVRDSNENETKGKNWNVKREGSYNLAL